MKKKHVRKTNIAKKIFSYLFWYKKSKNGKSIERLLFVSYPKETGIAPLKLNVNTSLYTSLLYNLVLKRIFFVFLRLQRNTGLFCITDKH